MLFFTALIILQRYEKNRNTTKPHAHYVLSNHLMKQQRSCVKKNIYIIQMINGHCTAYIPTID